jgi:hypothetical protein
MWDQVLIGPDPVLKIYPYVIIIALFGSFMS